LEHSSSILSTPCAPPLTREASKYLQIHVTIGLMSRRQYPAGADVSPSPHSPKGTWDPPRNLTNW